VIDLVPAIDLFDHYIEIQKATSSEIQWAMHAAMQPWRKEKDQKDVFDAAKKMATLGDNIREENTSVYERVPDEARVRMIGCGISTQGNEWTSLFPEQIQWLGEQGVTVDQAVQQHREWIDEMMESDFWE